MSTLKIGTVVFSLGLALAATGCGGSSTSGGGGSGSGTTGSGGGSGAVNNCTAAAAKDETKSSAVTITFADFAYSPACIKVAKGTKVTFSGAFASHPLQAGVVDSGAMTESVDKTSPIKETSSGTSKTFTFPDPGTFGYYCEFHGLSDGMDGAIIVE